MEMRFGLGVLAALLGAAGADEFFVLDQTARCHMPWNDDACALERPGAVQAKVYSSTDLATACNNVPAGFSRDKFMINAKRKDTGPVDEFWECDAGGLCNGGQHQHALVV